jgi:hypothetical protein
MIHPAQATVRGGSMDNEPRRHGIPTGPSRDLEEQRISPDEYAERVRRDVEEAVRESPPPPRERRRDNNESADQA